MLKNGARVALDSDVAIAILNDARGAGDRIRAFETIYLPIPTIGELWFGARNSGRPEANCRKVEGLIARCEVLDIRLSTIEAYARIRLDLKRKGKPIPENDVWIAAVCCEHGLPLATFDGHFQEIDRLSLAAF